MLTPKHVDASSAGCPRLFRTEKIHRWTAIRFNDD
jgi:hypothetical protein